MKYKACSMLCVAYLISASGCASFTAMQSAKPLAKDERQFSYALSALSLKKREPDTVASTIPGIDLMGRIGVTDHDEVGVRFANFGTFILVDYKRSIARTKPLYISAGVAFGFMQFFEDSAGNSRVFDIYLPLYADLTLRKDLALVFSPKYIFRTEEFHGRGLALSGGVRLGERQGFLVEAALAENHRGVKRRYWQLMVTRFKTKAAVPTSSP